MILMKQEKNYETALDIKEDYIEAHYSLAKLLLGGKATSKDGSTVDKRDWEIAKFHFRKVLQIDESSHKANYNLARILFEENSLKQAKACLAKAIKLEPKYSKAHFSTQEFGSLKRILKKRSCITISRLNILVIIQRLCSIWVSYNSFVTILKKQKKTLDCPSSSNRKMQMQTIT